MATLPWAQDTICVGTVTTHPEEVPKQQLTAHARNTPWHFIILDIDLLFGYYLGSNYLYCPLVKSSRYSRSASGQSGGRETSLSLPESEESGRCQQTDSTLRQRMHRSVLV